MTIFRRLSGVFVLVVLTAFGGACEKAHERVPVWLARADVAQPEVPPAESMAADVYIDATLSMTGYVADPNSVYVRLLDELEGSLANKWKKSADLRYFKFGSKVREVNRAEFRTARSAAFYLERGMFERTDIDLVASRATPKRLTVAVTDLFQDNQDLNPMVSSLRRNIFEKELAVGILSVGSEFDGKVYDARVPPFRYVSQKGVPSTYRPFYVLLFGDAAQIEQLVSALAEYPFIDRSRFLLIAPRIVRRYQVAAAKRAGSKNLKARAGSEADEFQFDVREDGRGGIIDTEIRLQPDPDAADFKTDGIDIVTRPTGAAGGAESRDVALQNVTRNGDVVKAALLLDIAAPKGKYSYDVVFRAGGAGEWTLPRWVDAVSSDNPTPRNEPNRTLNLKRLLNELIDASASIHRPPLARLRLNVRKLG